MNTLQIFVNMPGRYKEIKMNIFPPVSHECSFSVGNENLSVIAKGTTLSLHPKWLPFVLFKKTHEGHIYVTFDRPVYFRPFSVE